VPILRVIPSSYSDKSAGSKKRQAQGGDEHKKFFHHLCPFVNSARVEAPKGFCIKSKSNHFNHSGGQLAIHYSCFPRLFSQLWLEICKSHSTGRDCVPILTARRSNEGAIGQSPVGAANTPLLEPFEQPPKSKIRFYSKIRKWQISRFRHSRWPRFTLSQKRKQRLW